MAYICQLNSLIKNYYFNTFSSRHVFSVIFTTISIKLKKIIYLLTKLLVSFVSIFTIHYFTQCSNSIYSLRLILCLICIFIFKFATIHGNLKVSIPGDVLLGGIFPVHQKGNTHSSTQNQNQCGPINKDRGIQRVEAMLFALDKINQDKSILPTIQIGAIILDTCSSDTYALNQSLEFIRASVNRVENSAFECTNNSTLKSRYNTKLINGVVGGSYSEVSLQVANLLRLFRIPQVSYASTTTSLSDKSRYDFFARTVPPDKFQARALVDLIAYFNWSYVSIVSSEGQYGDSGLTAFIRNARNKNICIAINEKITHSANSTSYDQIIESLLTQPNAKGVVLFLRMEDARGLLLATKRTNKSGIFTWIAADGWGKELKLIENVEEIALGAITVELQSETILEFDHYFKRLKLPSLSDNYKSLLNKDENFLINYRNPWFKEYWQEVFQCSLQIKSSNSINNLNKFINTENYVNDESSVKHKINKMIKNSENFYHLINEKSDVNLLNQIDTFLNLYSKNFKYTKPVYYSKNNNYLNNNNNLVKKNKNKKLKFDQVNKNFHYQTKYHFHPRFKRDFNKFKHKKPICSNNLSLTHVYHKQEPKIQFVVDAVYSFAHALHNAWLDKCGGQGKVCQALKDLDGGQFYKNYLLKVSFLDLVGVQVRFDSHGDGLGRYNVYNLQRSNQSNTGFIYKRIGNWSDEGLRLDLSHIYWNIRNSSHINVPTSRCSEPCNLDEIKITQSTSETCCWICQKCKPFEYVYNEFKCEDCGYGYWPIENKSACFELPLTYINWTSYYALIPIVIASLGILLTFFVFFILIKHINTPIVKASGRELTFILLFGIICCFSMTFILLAKPTIYICVLQRFGIGFGFSIIYGALLTKTNRISRIFNSAKKSAKRPCYISPKSQVILTIILVSIQVIETGIWFLLEKPGTKKDVSDEKRWLVILKCRVKDLSTLFSLAYNMLLITTCTAYAFKTRKIPENFNESKFIGFTMYTTCIIWLAFVPIFFGTGNSYEIQITTLCTSISLSAYVTLFCLFSPKIYIIVFHPDKNVHKLTMKNTYKKSPTFNIYYSDNQGLNANQFKINILPETVSVAKIENYSNKTFFHNYNHNKSIDKKNQINKSLKKNLSISESNQNINNNLNLNQDLNKNINDDLNIDDQIENELKLILNKIIKLLFKKNNDFYFDDNLFNYKYEHLIQKLLLIILFSISDNCENYLKLFYNIQTDTGYKLRKRSNSFTIGQSAKFNILDDLNTEIDKYHNYLLNNHQNTFFNTTYSKQISLLTIFKLIINYYNLNKNNLNQNLIQTKLKLNNLKFNQILNPKIQKYNQIIDYLNQNLIE